jgi:hypothetical protein
MRLVIVALILYEIILFRIWMINYVMCKSVQYSTAKNTDYE